MISNFTANEQNIAGVCYILYLRNISFSSVSGSILAWRSLSIVFEFEFGSVRPIWQFGSVRVRSVKQFGFVWFGFGSISISTPDPDSKATVRYEIYIVMLFRVMDVVSPSAAISVLAVTRTVSAIAEFLVIFTLFFLLSKMNCRSVIHTSIVYPPTGAREQNIFTEDTNSQFIQRSSAKAYTKQPDMLDCVDTWRYGM